MPQLVKVILLVARFEQGRQQALLISLRGDQQLNEVKLSNWLNQQHGQAWGALLGIEPLEAKHVAAENALPLAISDLISAMRCCRAAKSWRAVFCA